MAQEEETQHALLIAWGRFAQEIGLIAAIEGVKLGQKVYEHTPQAKVLEFFVVILAGQKQLQEISLSIRWTKTRRSPKPGDRGWRLYRRKSHPEKPELG